MRWMNAGCLVLGLGVLSGAVSAEQADPCTGLEGAVLTQCRSNQETRRLQERLEQQLQEQQERQTELDKQQREVRQQLDSMRMQNESLRKQLEGALANPSARTVAMGSAEPSKNQDLKEWKAENPWFGSDYARTQLAMHYAKELQKERPELTGRPLLDALSTKVNETFGARP